MSVRRNNKYIDVPVGVGAYPLTQTAPVAFCHVVIGKAHVLLELALSLLGVSDTNHSPFIQDILPWNVQHTTGLFSISSSKLSVCPTFQM